MPFNSQVRSALIFTHAALLFDKKSLQIPTMSISLFQDRSDQKEAYERREREIRRKELLIRENSLKLKYDALNRNGFTPASRERSAPVTEIFLVLPQISREPVYREFSRANQLVVDSQPPKAAKESRFNCLWDYRYRPEKAITVTQAYEVVTDNTTNHSYDSPRYTMQDSSTLPSAPVSPYNPDYHQKSSYAV